MGPSKIYRSTQTVEIPGVDAASFVFSAGTPESRRRPQWFDAENPRYCYSLEQAEVYVKRIAKGLQDNLGLRPGDKVLVFSGNKLFYPVVVWSVIASGGVFTGSAPGVNAKELSHQLRNSEARFVLASADVVDVARDALREVGLPQESLFIFSDLHDAPLEEAAARGIRDWTSFWAPEDEAKRWHWKTINTVAESASTTCVINYSSGTTGLPKGVEISHRNCIANALQVVTMRGQFLDNARGRERKALLGYAGERWIAPLPMYHAYGQNYFCFNAVLVPAKVFIMRKFQLDKYMLYLDVYSVNNLTGAPAILARLAKHGAAGRYNLRSLMTVVSGSAPLGPGINEAFSRRFLGNGRRVAQGWGMSECTCSGSMIPSDLAEDMHSVGVLVPNLRAKLVPVPGQQYEKPAGAAAAATSEPGELWIAGDNVMKGYYNNPHATAATIVHEDGERWLRTGDIACFGPGGAGPGPDRGERLYIIDRLKELIKVNGLQVAPAEIELTLLAHRAVTDCAVRSARKQGDDNEYPQAFVVKADPAITEPELHTHIQSQLARHKWLTGGIFFVDEIPRTHSGKIIRRNLPNRPVTEVQSASVRAKL